MRSEINEAHPEVTHCKMCVHRPVEKLLRLGMDGEDVSCWKDDVLTA